LAAPALFEIENHSPSERQFFSPLGQPEAVIPKKQQPTSVAGKMYPSRNATDT
jgi:hypothetical protein